MELANAVAVPATHILAWLALSLTSGLGPTMARKWIEHFGSAEAVLHALRTESESTGIEAVFGPIGSYQESGGTGAGGDEARDRRWSDGALARKGLLPLTLTEIFDPPLGLYVRGNPEVLMQPGIAMVGTRHPTP